MMQDFWKSFLVLTALALFIFAVFLVAGVGDGYHHGTGNPGGGLTPGEEYYILNR